jgi:hypothetical protein
MTVMFGDYLGVVLVPLGSGFAVADGSPNSLGTPLGFDQSDGLAFFAARSDEMIRSYISFNLVWDSLFALVYGLMYISGLSVLFRPVARKTRLVNLLPALQVPLRQAGKYGLGFFSKPICCRRFPLADRGSDRIDILNREVVHIRRGVSDGGSRHCVPHCPSVEQTGLNAD